MKIIKIACVGDSITYGGNGAPKSIGGYTDRLQALLGNQFEVKNFGVQGTTALRKGKNKKDEAKSYRLTSQYTESIEYLPDIVVIMFGTNDAKSFNWDLYKGEFLQDYIDLINEYKSIASKPKIYIAKSPKVYGENGYKISPSILREEILPLIEQVAKETNTPLIDVFAATSNMSEGFGDKVHPSTDESKLAIATAIYKVLAKDLDINNAETSMKSWKFDFGASNNVAEGYIGVTADMAYNKTRGYGFLGLGPDGYKEDSRSDGFTMQEGQQIKLQDFSKLNVLTVDDYAIGVTDPAMPIRFAVHVTPNTYYKVKVTLTGADQTKNARVNLFSEKRHLLLIDKLIPAGTNLTYEFNVTVQNIYSKVTGTYEDNMLNIAVCGDNAAISSAEIQQIAQCQTLWVLGDSTVYDQVAPLPYFRLQNYAGVGQALSKYIGPNIAVSNHSESGLNAYSSIPHFDQFKDRIKPGDIVYFEFGHNHKQDGPTGYYDGIPYYYDFVHQKEAKFIVVGPIDRHNAYQYNAETNTWSSTLEGFSTIGKRYVDEKIASGATDIAFVDLNAPSLAWLSHICNSLGREATNTDYYFRGFQGEKTDGTHPNDAGVDNFAKMFFDSVKAIVNEDPKTPQAKVLSDLLVGLRNETPYTVPASITSLGPVPNSAYPEKYIPQVTYDYPLAIKAVTLDAKGKILSMSAEKQCSLSTYGRGIVEIYRENGKLKGTAYANEQIDNTIDGTQVVTFTTDLTLDANEKLKAYVMGFEDKPGYPLTNERLSDFYILN